MRVQTNLFTEEETFPGANTTLMTDVDFSLYEPNNQKYRVVPTTLRLNPLYVNVYLIFMNLFINGNKLESFAD